MRNFSERGNRKLKLLDRYVGIPVIFFLGLLKRKKTIPSSIKIEKVAFLKTAAIGDTILLSAAIKDLKEKYPDVHLTLFTSSTNYEMATMLTDLDRIIQLPVKDPLKAVRLIKDSGKYDFWIDFGSWPRLNAFFSFFSNSNIKIGFKTGKQYKHYVNDITIEHLSDIHEVNNYKNLLKPLNIKGRNLPTISLDPSCKSTGKFVIAHLFSGGEKFFLKEWPEENWIELINYLTDSDYRVYLTGTNTDKEKAMQIKERVNKENMVTVVAGKLSLHETAELLLSAQLVVSVDTGILHLASGLGCNLVALHGPTSFKKWGALNSNSVPIQSASKCSPCLNLGFDSSCTDNKCMRTISVKEVVASVIKFINTG